MTDFKDTKIYAVADFLKSNPNKPYKISDISKNLNINPKTVSSSISRLSKGANKKKNGRIILKKNGQPRKQGYEGFPMKNFKKVNRGVYQYTVKEKTIGKFETWKVDFKLIETNKKKKKNSWNITTMDLSSYAIGVVPFGTSQNKVIDISGAKLYKTTLNVLDEHGLDLWGAINDIDINYTLGATNLSEENSSLVENYDSEWNGELALVGSSGKKQTPDILKLKYDIRIDEY